MTTSASPTAHQLWIRYRALLAALLALLVFGALFAAQRSGENHNALDPRSADPQGSRAVAQLLAEQGVTTKVVTTAGEAASATGPDTTLLVAVPGLLTSHQLSALRSATAHSGGRTLLLSPGAAQVQVLTPGVRAVAAGFAQVLSANCDFPAARRAGDALTGGVQYTTSVPGADSCYPYAGRPTLLRLPSPGGGDTVVLGTTDLLRNDHLDEQGNASLALQLLGTHPKLVWYLPSLSDAAATSGNRSFLDLIPAGWTWAFYQLLIAAALAALWRARRLGPVIAERLPVAVRAAEATEGRARLYRRANARARAAEALRTATRERLAPLIGVPPSQAHVPGPLATTVAARLGDPAVDPHALLDGPPPPDDKALLSLADDLDTLERSLLSAERLRNP
jgi:hypothetical protein